MFEDPSPAHLRDASVGLELLGAALHGAATRHGVVATASRTRASQLGAAGDAPSLRAVEATLTSTSTTIADVPAHLEHAGSRALGLARTAASTAGALATVDQETTTALAAGRVPDLDTAAQRRYAEQLEQLARRRTSLLDGWQAACRTAQRAFEDAATALAALEHRLDVTVSPTTPRRLAQVVVGTWRVTEDLGALRSGIDLRAHATTLREGRRRTVVASVERDRRGVAAAARVGRTLRRTSAGVAAGAPSAVRRLGAHGRDAALRLAGQADARAARLSSSRLAQGVRAVGSHPTMRAVGKRLGPLGLVVSGWDVGTAIAQGRRTDALVGGAGAAAGVVLLTVATGATVAAPLVVGAAVVAAGVVVYEHREQLAAAGRWVGDRVRNGLRRVRGARPRCP